MPVLQESGLFFSFDKSWELRCYDRHTFFKGLSGAGLKGVDFIGIRNQTQLFLIEVKNFRYDAQGLRKHAVDARLSYPDQIAAELIDKAVDTVRAIQLIEKYFQTRFLFRLLRPILPYLKFFAPEWFFWSTASLLSRGSYRYVCWIALDPAHSQVGEAIEAAASARLANRQMQLLFQYSDSDPSLLPGVRVSTS